MQTRKILQIAGLLFIIGLFGFQIEKLEPHKKVGAPAEYLPPQTVIMHVPGEELMFMNAHPDAALAEHVMDIDGAGREQREYIKKLENKGIDILTIKEILLRGTVDENDDPIQGGALDSLIALTAEFLTYSVEEEYAEEQKKYKYKVLKKHHPRGLIRKIFNNMTVKLEPVDKNTGWRADYISSPLSNLYFLRDQMITTKKGIVIGRMSTQQRYPETKVIEFCLHKLGIDPIYRLEGKDSFLEGGDFLPFGDIAFLGNGVRTNKDGLDELLENQVFGTKLVAVVKDLWQKQDQMHLDTYFNIIDKDLVVLSEDRLNARIKDKKYLTVDVYERQNGNYVKTKSDMSFVEYLRKLKVQIIPVPNQDQQNYGVNFLTVGPREVMIVEGISKKYEQRLKKHNVKLNYLDFTNLKKGYGAAHCVTQVIRRKEISVR